MAMVPRLIMNTLISKTAECRQVNYGCDCEEAPHVSLAAKTIAALRGEYSKLPAKRFLRARWSSLPPLILATLGIRQPDAFVCQGQPE